MRMKEWCLKKKQTNKKLEVSEKKEIRSIFDPVEGAFYSSEVDNYEK